MTTDLITQLPPTRWGKDAIVVFVDKLTKMAHFTATTTTVAGPQLADIFMHEVVRLHGVPSVIVSDRDPRFTGGFWRALTLRIGIQCRYSTAYHPQTDGQTERLNRTLEQMLRAYVNSRHNDWDQFLDSAEFAYNSAPQESTKKSPFELWCGDVPPEPHLGNAVSQAVTVPQAAAVADAIPHSVQQAKTHLQQAQMSQQAQANKRRRDLEFEVGDSVLLSTVNLPIR